MVDKTADALDELCVAGIPRIILQNTAPVSILHQGGMFIRFLGRQGKSSPGATGGSLGIALPK